MEKPDNLQDLLRRALASQVDLGLGEIVLGKGRAAVFSELPVACAQSAKKVVSASEAVSLQTGSQPMESGPPQASMMLSQQPVYKSLDEHYKAICECQLCPLGETRNKFVYGVGSPNAGLMFIGEAPGAEEDRRGEPFVGRAGQLLDKILTAIDLSREHVYIANMLKCRPPGNRDPQPDEMAKCLPYLQEQIRLIKPKLICLLGRIAAQGLLKTTTPLGKLRGRWHELEGVPTLVSYHPAALLRFPAYKKDTWEDMKTLKARFDELK